MNIFGPSTDTGGVEFWHSPERAGWLDKQGSLMRWKFFRPAPDALLLNACRHPLGHVHIL
jgi:hypothetical protein